MSVQHAHSKLITAAAREVLRPLGLDQKGRSRMWFDDRGWWVGLVEFQPSSWNRGSYLNVGAQWLWDTEWDTLSAFMYPGDREIRVEIPGEGQLILYQSDQQFAPLARMMVDAVAKRVVQLAELPDIAAAARLLSQSSYEDKGIDAGIALGLVGDSRQARGTFERYLEWDRSEETQRWRGEWMDARAERVRVLLSAVADTERFRTLIRTDIRTVRKAVKLDPDVVLPF